MCTSHLGLVVLRHLDARAVPRLQPAVGDGGGVHAAALLLLKLCGARARLLCLGLTRLLPVGRSRTLSTALVSAVVRALRVTHRQALLVYTTRSPRLHAARGVGLGRRGRGRRGGGRGRRRGLFARGATLHARVGARFAHSARRKGQQ